jgi:hypothetical protein
MPTTPLGTGVTGLTLDLLAERIQGERELRESHEENANANLRTATEALEKRLEGLNEFRGQLSDQNRTFVVQTVFDAKIEALSARLNALERTAERTAGSVATWRFLAGGGGLLGLVSIVLWVIHPGAAT